MSGRCDACGACLRRTWLLARLGGRIEVARHEQRRLPEVLALRDHDLVGAVGDGERDGVLAERDAFDADEAAARVVAAGLTALCRHDPRYPPRLLHARDAPAVLHVLGDPARLEALADDEQRSVAIVGMRRATAYGLEMARALGRDLATAGVPVVSGMALGIDSAAHAGVLDAGGFTVSVLGGGADVPYPARKARLHAEIARTGLVLSEMPPGFRAFRWSFPARNRVIAGLTDLTVVVEAAERSGSLITAELAEKLGRDVAAVPGPVTAPGSAGPHALLRDGATLVRGAQDVLDALFGVGGLPALRRAPGDALDPRLAGLLAAIREGRDTINALAADDPAIAEAVLVGLTELELRELVRRESGGRYVVRM